MSIKPEPTAVGSSAMTSPQQIGDNSKMPPRPRSGQALKEGGGRWGDRVFRSIAIAAGATIIGAIALMGLFLLIRAVPSLQADKINFFTSSEFNTTDSTNLRFGVRRPLPGHRA